SLEILSRTSGQVALWFQFSASEAQIGDKISALVLDRHRTFHALQRLPGVFVAEVGGALVIRLGGRSILWPATARFRERAHLRDRARMILRRRLLEQSARAGLVLLAARAIGQHQTKLVLRRGIGRGGFRKQLSPPHWVRWRGTAAERRKIGDAAGIAGFGR